MEFMGVERRECKRFKIPGAVVSYKQNKVVDLKDYTEKRKQDEEFCPILDISCGGIRFISKNPLQVDSNVIMKIRIPGERIPLVMQGQTRWNHFFIEKKVYILGIQFNPFGKQKGQNFPANRMKIAAFEHKFSPLDDPNSK